MSVSHITIQHEGGCVNGSLERALGRAHGRPKLTFIENTHGLNSLSRNRVLRSVLPEELGISHGRVVKSHVVVHWSVEVFSCCGMALVVVLGALYIEVRNPSKLAVDISILAHLGVVGHPGALKLVQFVRVQFTLGLDKVGLLRFESLVEILLVMGMVLVVKARGNVVVMFVPLVIVRGQHSIVCVLIYDNFGCCLCI